MKIQNYDKKNSVEWGYLFSLCILTEKILNTGTSWAQTISLIGSALVGSGSLT